MESPSTPSGCVHVELERAQPWRRVSKTRRNARLAVDRARRDGVVPTAKYALRRLGLTKKAGTAVRSRPIEEEALDLQPGDLVEVKSKEEIEALLDSAAKTRGLYFMPEMWKFCGGQYRVLKRLEKYKVESTGRTVAMRNTVLLEGVHCDGEYNDNCAATCYHFWREAWLRRVESD